MLGVVKLLVPVPPVNAVPPVAAAYQSIVVPAGTPDTDNATVPVPQREPFTAVAVPGSGFTVAVTALRVALTQPVVVLRVSA
jgi:hypothetical protein